MMPGKPDEFRDFGILPPDLPAPPELVRAAFSTGTVIGQYIAMGLLGGFGLGIAVLFAFTLPLGVLNLLPAALAVALSGLLIYLITRHDYRWIELDGETLRARHLYTGRVVERRVDEIEELLTHVFQVRTAAAALTDAWLGRVRAIEIRFFDGRTPLRVSRTDPAMRNARELIEAVIYRMSRQGEVDAEVINLDGRPLIRRLFRKE
jgi:hypothetical protein